MHLTSHIAVDFSAVDPESGFRIRIRNSDPESAFFLIRDPRSGMGKKLGSGSRKNHQDHISESLETFFFG
jgi:hypothetical protein